MHIEEEKLTKDTKEALVRDRYGILQLAANATMNSTPKLFPLTWREFKEWVKRVIITVNQFWKNNRIHYPDLVEKEPSDFINQIYWEVRLKKGKDE